MKSVRLKHTQTETFNQLSVLTAVSHWENEYTLMSNVSPYSWLSRKCHWLRCCSHSDLLLQTALPFLFFIQEIPGRSFLLFDWFLWYPGGRDSDVLLDFYWLRDPLRCSLVALSCKISIPNLWVIWSGSAQKGKIIPIIFFFHIICSIY